MEEELTPEEADALFEQTQPIGDAIRRRAAGEVVPAALPTWVRARVDQVLAAIRDDDCY